MASLFGTRSCDVHVNTVEGKRRFCSIRCPSDGSSSNSLEMNLGVGPKPTSTSEGRKQGSALSQEFPFTHCHHSLASKPKFTSTLSLLRIVMVQRMPQNFATVVAWGGVAKCPMVM
jgi:hypothetical protein